MLKLRNRNYCIYVQMSDDDEPPQSGMTDVTARRAPRVRDDEMLSDQTPDLESVCCHEEDVLMGHAELTEALVLSVDAWRG